MSTLVTGEAVSLDIRPASLGLRAVSCAIDYALIMAVYIGIVVTGTWLFSTVFDIDGLLLSTLFILITVFCAVLLPFSVEVLTRGRSVGKLICGLRIVREDGGAVTARHSFVRALLYSVEVFGTIAGTAALVGLLSPQSKRLGDYLAGTIAVNERAGLPRLQPIIGPPALAGWAARADISSLPPGLAYRITQFLSSARLREPASRWERAVELAEEVNPYVAPAPPEGTLPEEFLAAIIAATRAEQAAQLERSAEAAARFEQRVGHLPHGLRLERS